MNSDLAGVSARVSAIGDSFLSLNVLWRPCPLHGEHRNVAHLSSLLVLINGYRIYAIVALFSSYVLLKNALLYCSTTF